MTARARLLALILESQFRKARSAMPEADPELLARYFESSPELERDLAQMSDEQVDALLASPIYAPKQFVW